MLGAKWIRAEVPWFQIEPRKNAFDFTLADRIVNRAEQLSLRVCFILAYCPEWASAEGKATAVPRPSDWQGFVERIVRRYAGRVGVWAIWNEPNTERFFGGDGKDYVRTLLEPAAKIIRAEDPEARIAAPEIAHQPSHAKIKPEAFLAEMRDLGADSSFDILTHHLYARDVHSFQAGLLGSEFTGDPADRGIKRVVAGTGWSHKEFWLTEFGWDSLEIGEAEQAARLVDAIRCLGEQSWVGAAHVYEIKDDERFTDQFRWGLMRSDGTPKLSFHSVKEAIRAVDAPTSPDPMR